MAILAPLWNTNLLCTAFKSAPFSHSCSHRLLPHPVTKGLGFGRHLVDGEEKFREGKGLTQGHTVYKNCSWNSESLARA